MNEPAGSAMSKAMPQEADLRCAMRQANDRLALVAEQTGQR